MLRSHTLIVASAILLFVGCIETLGAGEDPDPADIVMQLLNEDIGDDERRALVEEHTDIADDILRELIADLESGTDEEARRIPWIWRVTITATAQNDPDQIRDLIEIALPKCDAPLLNWQGVALGGGIVNGISREGGWPLQRIDQIIEGDQDLQKRWQRAVKLSYGMAADSDVPHPWRYDALRMIAMDDEHESIPALISYLEPNRDDHLHMGAVSGLSDIPSPAVTEPLISALPYLSDGNKNLALDALLRTTRRTWSLLDAMDDGEIPIEELGEERIEQLNTHEDESIRQRINALN